MKTASTIDFPFTIQEQIALLQSRGLVFSDMDKARHSLQFISCYRFCDYAAEFELLKKGHYKSGTTFDQVLDLYIFDRKLRAIVIDAIEYIEVAVRAVMTNQLSQHHGAYWYENKELFLPTFRFNDFIDMISKQFFRKIQDGSLMKEHLNQKLPPIWVVAEMLSLGNWSVLFANLASRNDQKLICNSFELNYRIMTSWLHTLTNLRNLCAHHGRLWNRRFIFKPIIAKKYHKQLSDNALFVAQAAIIQIFLKVVAPTYLWGKQLQNLITEHPKIDLFKMGFRDFDWEEWC